RRTAIEALPRVYTSTALKEMGCRGGTCCGNPGWRYSRLAGGRKLHFAGTARGDGLSRLTQGWRRSLSICGVVRLLVTHRHLSRRFRRIVATHLVLVVNLKRFAQLGDLDNGNPVADKLHKVNGLRLMAVDPFLVGRTVWVATLLLPNLAFWFSQRGKHHTMVHPYQNLVHIDRLLHQGRECVRVGLLRGLDPEINDRCQQRLYLRCRYVRHKSLKDQGHAGTYCLLPGVCNDR